jgi:hypothetical protein
MIEVTHFFSINLLIFIWILSIKDAFFWSRLKPYLLKKRNNIAKRNKEVETSIIFEFKLNFLD